MAEKESNKMLKTGGKVERSSKPASPLKNFSTAQEGEREGRKNFPKNFFEDSP